MEDAGKLGEREIGGMLQGIGTAGRGFRRRPWFKRGCCANDDDHDDDDDDDDSFHFITCNRVLDKWSIYLFIYLKFIYLFKIQQ